MTASARAQTSPSATMCQGRRPPGPKPPAARSRRPRATEALPSARCEGPGPKSPRIAPRSSAR
eukprot:13426261-Alexandrium_andersonii.AAC.1